MPVSTLRLLDRFALVGSTPSPDLPLGLQRLVAFLALHGPAHRGVTAGTLWPDVPDQQALACLRTAVWRVGKLLPDLVLTEGQTLRLSATVEVDSRRQEDVAVALLRHGVDDPDWLRAGLPCLWPGELLPGWYDDWVVPERDRLTQLRLHAMEKAARLFTERRELDVAVELALEAVRTGPLRETANATLIAAYVAEGNVADAIHQYEVFETRLDRELGLPPSFALAELLDGASVLTG